MPRAPRTVAHHPLAVRIVHHHEAAELVGQRRQLRQRGDIAVHTEHAVAHQQRAPVQAALRTQHGAQAGRVVVRIADDFRPAQATSVNDAGVVELVRKDGIPGPDQRSRGRMAPRLAQKPDWNEMAASASLKRASRSSSSRCSCVVPAMVRTAAGPTPSRGAHHWPPAPNVGRWPGRP